MPPLTKILGNFLLVTSFEKNFLMHVWQLISVDLMVLFCPWSKFDNFYFNQIYCTRESHWNSGGFVHGNHKSIFLLLWFLWAEALRTFVVFMSKKFLFAREQVGVKNFFLVGFWTRTFCVKNFFGFLNENILYQKIFFGSCTRTFQCKELLLWHFCVH